MNTYPKPVITGVGAVVSAAAAILAFSTSASAAALTWTLQNVAFTDSGTATGSFNYDADTNTYSQVNISVAGGNVKVFPPITYDAVVVSLYPTPLLGQFQSSSTGGRFLDLSFFSPLTNAGGAVQLSTIGNLIVPASGELIVPTGPNPNPNIAFGRSLEVQPPFFSGGSVSAAPVPEPDGTAGYAVMALGGAWLLKKKVAQS